MILPPVRMLRAPRAARVLSLIAAAWWCAAVAAALPQAPAGIEWEPWQVLLPLDQPGGAARIAEPSPLEEELPKLALGKEGPDFRRVFRGKNAQAVTWQPLDEKALVGSVPGLGAIDLLKLLPTGMPGNDASAYFYRRVRVQAAATVRGRLGYDDAARVWLNGRLVAESLRPGPFEPLSDPLVLELQPGDNHLLFKVTNTGGGWKFRYLIGDAKPLAGRAAAQVKVNEAIERGCDYLVGQQLRDGSWGYDDLSFPGGQTALSIYALLKSGVSPRHQSIQRGIAYLRARPTPHTYTAGCTLLALWALHDPAHEEWIAEIADNLMSWQRTGMWAYPHGDYDLSNTQYAVLGLLAAARSGVKIPPKVWRDVMTQTMRHQGKHGGFGYKIDNGNVPTGSMTAAGISVLAIARGQLTEEGQKNVAGMSVVDESIAAGARWLGERFTVTGSPQVNPRTALDARWGPYYLYGVERACTLLGLERLADSDWYWEGASWLLDVQTGEGAFPTPWAEHEANTSFGLLFLTRATASFTGQGTARKDHLHQTDDAKSDVWVRGSGDAQLALWVAGFAPKVLEQHAWKAAGAQGLHIAKLEYLIDGEIAAVIHADARLAWDVGDKFPMRASLQRAGVHRIVARVHVMLEPATPGGDPGNVVLESAALEVDVQEIAEPALLEQASEGTRNLVRASETKLTASSQFSDTPAANAFDGRQSSVWTCQPDDAKPWILAEFERPLRANRLGFSVLGGRAANLGDWDRATKLELRINKADPVLAVELSGDELRKTYFEFTRSGPVRSLEIRVVDRAKGTKHPGRLGFAEVELFYDASNRK